MPLDFVMLELAKYTFYCIFEMTDTKKGSEAKHRNTSEPKYRNFFNYGVLVLCSRTAYASRRLFRLPYPDTESDDYFFHKLI